jgi:hypothetical protein
VKKQMGLFLPIVGYLAARKHNPGGEETEWDRKRRAELEMFVGGLRIAYLEGWGNVFAPLSKKTENKEQFMVHPKSYEHRIFFDNDLENRPGMRDMMEFLTADPAGGVICVVDHEDLTDASVGQYNTIQCKTVKSMLNIPVIECGSSRERSSLINQLMGGRGKSQVVQTIAMSALNLRDGHTRRLGARDFKERFCDMQTADLSEASAYRAMREAHDAGTLCPDCVTKWTSHQNVINPRAQHIPPHKVA